MVTGLRCRDSKLRQAFSFLELLVVSATIGLLIAILLPALQAAREATRNSQCRKNLRSIAIGALRHEDTRKSFPYGGWSFGWMGDPDQAIGPQQPGSWIYTTGRYMDVAANFDAGAGLPWNEKKAALAELLSTAIPNFNCPSRRPAVALPARSPSGVTCENGILPKNADLPVKVAKADYAINGGAGVGWDDGAGGTGGAPEESCLRPSAFGGDDGIGNYPNCAWHIYPPDAYWQRFNGVSGWRIGARMGQISDGLSKTVLVGEKFLQPQHYEHSCPLPGGQPSKGNGGDNGSMYIGYDLDVARTGQLMRDYNPQIGLSIGTSHFGSAHPEAANFAFCDGSVRSIRYDIENFQRFVVRNDGL